MRKVTYTITLLVGISLISCSPETKTVSPVLVSILQYSNSHNYNSYSQGQETLSELKEVAQDRSVPGVSTKSARLLVVAKEIDEETAKTLDLIRELQLGILKSCGERTDQTGGDHVISERQDREKWSPILYNLKMVDPAEFGKANELTGAAKKKLIESVLHFRSFVTEKLASSSSNDEYRYSFKDPQLNTFERIADLTDKLRKKISTVSPDDQEILIRLYVELTGAQDMVKHLLQPSCSRLEAFGMLLNLEGELLESRYLALTGIRSRVSGCNYSFNKIMPAVSGPSVVKKGSDITFSVAVAAFDSDKQPIAAVSGATITEVKNGQAYISYRGDKSGLQKVTGKITILNKSDIPKTLEWEKEIFVTE